MADYIGTDLATGTWSGASGTAGQITPHASANVVVVELGGYNFTSDTCAVTLNGVAADESFQASSGGDACSLHIFANPATGSPINVAWSGLDTGDSGSWCAYGVSGANATSVDASGFSQTYTQTASGTPSTTFSSLTVDDLCVDGAHCFDGANSRSITEGTGQAQIYENWNTEDDTRDFSSYEKATGTSATMSCTISGTVDGNSYAAAVIPTAVVAGSAVTEFGLHAIGYGVAGSQQGLCGINYSRVP